MAIEVSKVAKTPEEGVLIFTLSQGDQQFTTCYRPDDQYGLLTEALKQWLIENEGNFTIEDAE